jgi:hypothetical protein|eukprot:CAMPEP_0174364152 /NCGR_PEP_ID=MMETSP0811_2-20130205/71766_1 /TAXON_ID=73025 ORGANISM="Eutreptiella gymnastica-like, Strain CCMP1594" /NCGR_SAMPLE_ID=MMETSP0811_2 /ASSEMBLY_ACC=CAM_ASM_000667 /LENGTH=68 /DNA_ID=CAMNT_0015503527 /DNA_START=1314 /DNA_END=1520 /DNA_ORIENTATION=-
MIQSDADVHEYFDPLMFDIRHSSIFEIHFKWAALICTKFEDCSFPEAAYMHLFQLPLMFDVHLATPQN